MNRANANSRPLHETVARQEFLESTDAYMKSGEANDNLENKIELVMAFLEIVEPR
jgi:hypothetical protein